MYKPHVIGVMTGQQIKIKNSDPTNHNIHPLPQVNQEWNESQPPGSADKMQSFPRQEVLIPVKCNIHPWMRAYIGVVSHPFFAVTGDDGTYTLKGLPPGTYTIEIVHEKYGKQEQQVTVGAEREQDGGLHDQGVAIAPIFGVCDVHYVGAGDGGSIGHQQRRRRGNSRLAALVGQAGSAPRGRHCVCVHASGAGCRGYCAHLGPGFEDGKWLPFGLMVAQALLGGLTVLLVLPKWTVLAHACLAQLCFGVLVAQSYGWPDQVDWGGRGPAALLAAVALFAQTILGAAVRHQLVGPIPHIAGAIVATLIVLWAVVPVMMEHMREAGALLALTGFQIFLGMGAYYTREMEAPQPMPMMVWFTAASCGGRIGGLRRGDRSGFSGILAPALGK